jgi:hypothetical protein
MFSLLLRADEILHQRFNASRATDARSLGTLAACIVVFGCAYGAVMGTFGGLVGERLWQVVYSGSKVPLLFLATFSIAAPSFLVLNVLFGLRDDVLDVLRALLAAQAGVAIVLCSLAPVTAFWYFSSDDYQAAILFNGIIFLIACIAGQHLLRGYYAPLVARNHRHRTMCQFWLGLYSFVGIQMGWVLRPFVGDPMAEVQFFREDSWGNAYVVVWKLVADVALR